jgi:hypothetical protein
VPRMMPQESIENNGGPRKISNKTKISKGPKLASKPIAVSVYSILDRRM